MHIIRRSCAVAAIGASCLTATACQDVTGPSETVASVVVVAPTPTVSVGGTLQLVASVLNSSGVSIARKSVEWSSLQPSIASVSPAGVVTGIAAGTVTIRAANGTLTGSVTLNVQPVACSATSTTGPIAVGQSVSGSLAGVDCVHFDGRLADGWVLTVSTPTTIRISMTSTAFDALLVVTDQAMNVVDADDDGGGNGNARLARSFTPGTYVVWATSYSSGATGAYALTTASVIPCGSGTTVGSLAVGQTVSGNISSTDCLLPALGGVADGWTLTVSEPTTIGIGLATEQFEPLLYVTDQAMNVVAYGQGGAGSSAQVVHSFAPGTYIVWASSYPPDAPGAYTLTAESVLACGQGTTTGAIAVGQTVIGAVDAEDCILPHGRPGEGWSFTVETTSALRFDVQGTGLFPALLATGTSAALPVVAVGYPSANGSATIVQTFPPGEYLLWVTTVDSGLGSYELSLNSAVIASCDEPGGTIAVGQNIAGALSFEDCQLPDGRFADLRLLTLATPATLQVDLVSSAFDAYLIVRDQAGNVIAADDDGGGSLNSRIVHSFPAGTYTIVATTYSSGQTGPYELRVQPPTGGGGAGLVEGGAAKPAVPAAPAWPSERVRPQQPASVSSSGAAIGRGGKSMRVVPR